MAAKRLSRSAINWAELQRQCPRHQVDQFRDFKTRTDAVVSKIASLPESLPHINWENYFKTVPVPGLAEKFKKDYEAMKVPYPKDTGNVGDKIRMQGAKMMEDAKHHSEVCEKMKNSAIKMKSAVSSLPKLEELVPEVTLAYFPLTNLDPFRTGESKPVEEKTIMRAVAPKAHWDFN
ncbi:unnamed protein product [Calicophoron daubneyi]|uniref:ATP synthase subunit d, mitochondrial n=1 Tax=Calicophoron daubneyi TaxID=300641 RepID=A0AAV2U0A1_CALDB